MGLARTLGVCHDLQNALVLGGDYLHKVARKGCEAIQQFDAARTRRVAHVLFDQRTDLLKLGIGRGLSSTLSWLQREASVPYSSKT